MPQDFRLPLDFGADPIDVYVPFRLGQVNLALRGGHYLYVLARLRPGVTQSAADAEVRAMAEKMAQEYTYSPEFGAFTRPVIGQVLGEIRPTMMLLGAAVFFVLLIACANVANLLLARAHSRQREMALRATLGANRWRIMRQLLVEGLLLAMAGGCVGLALAFAGVHAITALAPTSIPRIRGAGIDASVLAFAIAASLTTGLACSLLPAAYSTRVDLHIALKETGRGATADRVGDRMRSGLVTIEVALSVILLIGAGLLIKSYARLSAVKPGFDASGVLTVRLSLPATRYPDNRSVHAFYARALDRLKTIPGVDGVAFVRALPMTGEMGDWSFMVEGQQTGRTRFPNAGDWQVVSPDYFRIMKIALREGRSFSEIDDERASGTVMINEALARRLATSGQIVGRRIRMGGTSDTGWRTVIGIVGDVRHRGLDADPRPELYLPEAQWPAGQGSAQRSLYVVLRARHDPLGLEADVRRAINAIDPSLPLSGVRTMESVMSGWSAERRLTVGVLLTLATAAALLAAVGLFGVIGFIVSQRTSEIGIRRALGAHDASVIGLVTRQGAVSVALGLVIGIVGAVTLSRLIRALLFDVSPTDVATFLLVPILLAGVAALAAYLPARRATKVDPITALRAE
jgi:putative ABC transport system permease protein